MRKDIILPALALAGGGAGFLLRLWQYASAYDPASQLFDTGAPASLALVAWAVVMGALVFGRVPYDRWIRYVWKLLAIFFVLTVAFLILGVLLA